MLPLPAAWNADLASTESSSRHPVRAGDEWIFALDGDGAASILWCDSQNLQQFCQLPCRQLRGLDGSWGLFLGSDDGLSCHCSTFRDCLVGYLTSSISPLQFSPVEIM